MMAITKPVAGLLLLLLLGGERAPQREKASGSIALGEASAPPGSAAVAPLALSLGEGVRLKAVMVKLTYDGALVSFERVEPSGLSLAAGAELTSEVQAGSDGGSSTLHLGIAAESAEALSSGPLAYVAFRIDPAAAPETAITVRLEASGRTADEPPQEVALDSTAATITVTAPPVPACFFYMH